MSLKPSDTIDRLVAEHVMDYCLESHGEAVYIDGVWRCQEDGRKVLYIRHLPVYSRDIATAWTIVDRFREASRAEQIAFTDALLVPLSEEDELIFSITPLRICLAALRAVGVDVEKQ